MNKAPASLYQEEIYDAVANNYVLRLKSLLDSGGSPDSIDTNGRTALYEAAGRGHIEIIEVLLEAGARVNMRRPGDSSWTRNSTALNEAIYQGKFDAAQLLLDRGADPRIFGTTHSNAAHILLRTRFTEDIEEKGLELLKQILDKGVDPNGVCSSGQSVLDTAISYGAPVAFVSELISRGADPRKSMGDTPKQHRYWFERNLDVLRFLVENGGNINCRDFAGDSMLGHAGDVEALDEMIRLGGDINQVNHIGQNTLATFIDTKNIDEKKLPIMVRLIEVGIDVDRVDYGGDSVNSMLAARSDELSGRLKGLIAAKAARNVMTAARARVHMPS